MIALFVRNPIFVNILLTLIILSGAFAAFSMLREILPDCPPVACVGGKGFQTAELRRTLADLGLEDKVRLIGYVAPEMLPVLYNMALLLVVPSFYEGFGLPVLEAMACGVPVIGSQVGGLGEVVINGTTGYLAPVGDVDAMAQHAVELLANTSKLSAFRSASVDRAAMFNPDRVVSLYEAMYQRLVDQ